MLSAVVRSNLRKVVAVNSSAVRSFGLFDVSKERDIPKDIDYSYGRRLNELINEKAGDEPYFVKGAIVPPANAGTKENPILVPSSFPKRAVGYTCPMTHTLVWFNLEKGPLHFCPEINLYFKMQVVEGEGGHH